MLIFFLQTRTPAVLPVLQQIPPEGQAEAPAELIDDFNVYFYKDIAALEKTWPRQNTQSTGELLFQFFHFYAHEFPYLEGVVCIRKGALISKEGKRWTKKASPLAMRDGFQRLMHRFCSIILARTSSGSAAKTHLSFRTTWADWWIATRCMTLGASLCVAAA